MLLWVVLALIFTAFFWYYFVRPLSYWKKQGVKQSPRPWILLGDDWKVFLQMQNICRQMEWAYWLHPKERYTGIYQIGNRPSLIIKDPELIKQVTVKDFDHFTDHLGFVDPKVDPLWGGNLLFLKGNAWRNMRVTLSPSFTSSKMKFLFDLINDAGQNFVKYFATKNEDIIELEIKDTFTRFANDVIATAAFGIQVDSLKNKDNEFYKMGKQVTKFDDFATIFKFFVLILTPKLAKWLKIQVFPPKLSSFFKGLINETIEVRELQNIVRPDMINLLLEARKGIKFDENLDLDTGFATVQESDIGQAKIKGKLNLTNDDIAAQALIFFFAGFDTVSAAMCFAAYELATHSKIQQELRDKITETQQKCNGKLTYEAVVGMKYMDMVVSEVLRLWNPPVILDRVCVKPYVIKPINPGEKPVTLEVGNTIIIPSWPMHRDPKYFPEPDKFIPERFSDENRHEIQPYTYTPFGVGPRNCIGSRFALLEIKTVLFYLLSKYELIPTNRTPIPMKLDKKSFTPNAEGGFWMALKRLDNQ